MAEGLLIGKRVEYQAKRLEYAEEQVRLAKAALERHERKSFFVRPPAEEIPKEEEYERGQGIIVDKIRDKSNTTDDLTETGGNTVYIIQDDEGYLFLVEAIDIVKVIKQ